MTRPVFIGSEIYRHSTYGAQHPLAIPRVSTVIDLCRALGWLDGSNYADSPCATVEQLGRFHTADYIEAVMQAEREQRVSAETRERYNLGRLENPVFGEMFRRPATAVGGGQLAARLLAGGGIVYNPAGGTHHGRRDRASGFCYFNEPVLTLLALLDAGLERIAYVDVDVHHGDGVEAAFHGVPQLRCISVHEAGRWPNTGRADDRAGGAARNLPTPPGMNDSEMDYIAEQAILPLVDSFRPQAIVLQGGADALADDPLGRQELSNGALWRIAARLIGRAPRLYVSGGGGYNPWSVARCWSGMWATLNGFAIPARLPPPAEKILRALTWRRSAGRNPPERWFTSLADPPNEGPVRDCVKRTVDMALVA